MIHYPIHQLCNKNSSGGFYRNLTGDVNIIDYTISFVLEACSGNMDGQMCKKDNSSSKKHHLKHTGQFHKEKLKNKFKDKSLNWEASTVRYFALDYFFHCSMMDSTYYQQLHILTGLFQSIITIDHTVGSAIHVRVHCLSQNAFSFCK